MRLAYFFSFATSNFSPCVREREEGPGMAESSSSARIETLSNPDLRRLIFNRVHGNCGRMRYSPYVLEVGRTTEGSFVRTSEGAGNELASGHRSCMEDLRKNIKIHLTGESVVYWEFFTRASFSDSKCLQIPEYCTICEKRVVELCRIHLSSNNRKKRWRRRRTRRNWLKRAKAALLFNKKNSA